LLRSAFKDRIDGLARAVQGGIMAPNEARNSEDLDSVEYGDEPRVQQQVVPLSAAASIPRPGSTTTIPASPPAPPQPPQPPAQRSYNDAEQHAFERMFDNRVREIEWEQRRQIQ
jgi:hypothetical protein